MQFFLGFRTIIRRIKAIKFMMADKSVSKGKKLLVILGIIYIFLPIDLIPIVIFPLGILDDIIIWLLILWYLKDTLDSYWQGGKTNDFSKKYKNKTIIDDVDFEIKEEKKRKNKDSKDETGE